VRPKAERRKSQPGTASRAGLRPACSRTQSDDEASRMPGPSSGTRDPERVRASVAVLLSLSGSPRVDTERHNHQKTILTPNLGVWNINTSISLKWRK
jgi:hypothetical protein